jgi:hypothetical protein
MVNPVARDIKTKKPGINNGIRFHYGKSSGRVFLRSSVSAKFEGVVLTGSGFL